MSSASSDQAEGHGSLADNLVIFIYLQCTVLFSCLLSVHRGLPN